MPHFLSSDLSLLATLFTVVFTAETTLLAAVDATDTFFAVGVDVTTLFTAVVTFDTTVFTAEVAFFKSDVEPDDAEEVVDFFLAGI